MSISAPALAAHASSTSKTSTTTTTTASASPSLSSSAPLGNDVSWPQCSKPFPTGQAFGAVGLNGGTAVKDNPCLLAELKWAASSSGAVASQKKIQLYVNTANPGDQHVASWPTSNTDPTGTPAPNPFTVCDGTDSDACAWQYGWNRAVEDVQNRFIPAAKSLGLDANPANYPWWLDVETVNSWESGTTSALRRNAHDLEGMMAYLRSVGVSSSGIYSTSYQWGQIVGQTITSGSNLNNGLSWLAGSSSSSAKRDCTAKQPLTTGSTIAMTQYVSGRFDYDYSCL